MLMQEYETTVVIRPDIGGDAVESTLDRVRDTVAAKGGKLLAINHWGRKRLAYEIKKQTRGIYVHTHYLGIGDLVKELERNLRISDNVLRYLTVNLGENVDPESCEVASYEAPEYDAEEIDEHRDEAKAKAEGKEEEAEAKADAKPEADVKPEAEEPKAEEPEADEPKKDESEDKE